MLPTLNMKLGKWTCEKGNAPAKKLLQLLKFSPPTVTAVLCSCAATLWTLWPGQNNVWRRGAGGKAAARTVTRAGVSREGVKYGSLPDHILQKCLGNFGHPMEMHLKREMFLILSSSSDRSLQSNSNFNASQFYNGITARWGPRQQPTHSCIHWKNTCVPSRLDNWKELETGTWIMTHSYILRAVTEESARGTWLAQGRGSELCWSLKGQGCGGGCTYAQEESEQQNTLLPRNHMWCARTGGQGCGSAARDEAGMREEGRARMSAPNGRIKEEH